MADQDKIFAGSVPVLYDRYLVPLIFEDFAADMAARIAVKQPAQVLETAAGSGVVTRALAPLLAADARYVVTDLNPPMLKRAAERQPADSRVEWRQADALDLPFGDGEFDVVCCQFGVMFLPDKTAGYREAYRVLRAGGAFVFNVWDRIEENTFADVVTQSLAESFPDDPPEFMARTPHGYHDVDVIQVELADVGFVGVEMETITLQSIGAAALDVAMAYCQGTPLRNEIEARSASRLEEVTDRAAVAIAELFGDGEVTAQIRGHVFVAQK